MHVLCKMRCMLAHSVGWPTTSGEGVGSPDGSEAGSDDLGGGRASAQGSYIYIHQNYMNGSIVRLRSSFASWQV